MTLRFRGVAVDPPQGGLVSTSPEATVIAPGTAGVWTHGAAFGPLLLNTSTNSTLGLDGLTFEAAEPSFVDRLLSGLGIGTAAVAVAATESETDTPVSRRELLVWTGLAAGAFAAPAAADSATPTKEIARLNIGHNPDGVFIAIRDAVADVLPAGARYAVVAGHRQYAEFDARDGYATLPAGLTGEVSILTEGLESPLASALASFSDDELSSTYELPAPARDLDTGEAVTLTTDLLLARSIATVGADETTVDIGETSIPHRTERDDQGIGYYQMRDGALTYVAGVAGPSSTTITVRTRVDRMAEALDDAQRGAESATRFGDPTGDQ